MPKVKTNKSALKRVKITSSGKVMRRNQLATGHLRRNKSKGALNRHKKSTEVFKATGKQMKRAMGI